MSFSSSTLLVFFIVPVLGSDSPHLRATDVGDIEVAVGAGRSFSFKCPEATSEPCSGPLVEFRGGLCQPRGAPAVACSGPTVTVDANTGQCIARGDGPGGFNLTAALAALDARLSEAEGKLGDYSYTRPESALARVQELEVEVARLDRLVVLLNATKIDAKSQPTITDGLLAHYCFESSTSMGDDCSGHGRHASATSGSVAYATASASQAGEISSTGVGVFDGGDLLEADFFKNYRFGGTFGAAMWFKRTSNDGNYQGVVSTGYGCANGNFEFRFGREDGGTAFGGGVCTTGNDQTWDFQTHGGRHPIHASLNNWHHAGMTYSKELGHVYFYLNGELHGPVTRDFGDMLVKDTPLYMGQAGKGNPGGRENFKGHLDDVRIYDRFLTEEDFHQIYSENKHLNN